ncbi:hypothetical protein ABIE19_003507, partial [Brevundimonas faecalis]
AALLALGQAQTAESPGALSYGALRVLGAGAGFEPATFRL